MNIRDIIQKARETAKNPDEMLLSERFEEYLDLIELRAQVKTRKEAIELEMRLKSSLSLLKAVADRVALSYGVEPESLTQFFTGQVHIGTPKIEREKKDDQPPKAKRRGNKRVRV